MKIHGINRAKLLAMGKQKILRACEVHFVQSQNVVASQETRYRHRCLLAQCQEILRKAPAQ